MASSLVIRERERWERVRYIFGFHSLVSGRVQVGVGTTPYLYQPKPSIENRIVSLSITLPARRAKGGRALITKFYGASSPDSVAFRWSNVERTSNLAGEKDIEFTVELRGNLA